MPTARPIQGDVMEEALVELTRRFRPPAVIFDIDSTLSSAAHRSDLTSGTLGGKDWSTFHGGMVLDAPIQHTVDKLKAHVARGDRIVLLSMRPERFRTATVDWLRGNGIEFDELYLRPEGNYRPGIQVKEDIFRKEIAPRFVVKTAYDDREDLVEMWNRVGIDARKVTDPGLPPLEGHPIPDPKYPKDKPLSLEEARARLKKQASSWDKRPAGKKYGGKQLGAESGDWGHYDWGSGADGYFVGPHVRKLKGKSVPVVGYWVDRKMSFSAVDRLRSKVGGSE